MQKSLTANIEEFLEDKKYKFKVYAVENYGKDTEENYLVSLTVYFYPSEKNILKKTEEFHEIFKKYYTQLKIPCKEIIIRKEAHLHEYSLDNIVIALGGSVIDDSYYLQFASYGKKSNIPPEEINKIKESFYKFRDFLECCGCKSKRLDFFINNLSRHWLIKYENGLPPSIVLESHLKADSEKKYKLSKNFVEGLVDEYLEAVSIFKKNNSVPNKQKNLFRLVEEITDIVRPISLLLDRRIQLPKDSDEAFIKWCTETIEEYKVERERILDKIDQDPEQKRLESYEYEYVDILSQIQHMSDEKERKKLIKKAEEIAAKFNYDPKKDLEKYLNLK